MSESLSFLQLCYVTNDFEQAMDRLRHAHAIGSFNELRDHHVPMGPGRVAISHYGLAFKAGTQFEVIEPLSGDVGIYRDFLQGEGFQMRFHHIGRHVPSFDEYREALRKAGERWSIAVDMSAFGGHYAYADARSDYGHYLEWFCFPDGSVATGVPRY